MEGLGDEEGLHGAVCCSCTAARCHSVALVWHRVPCTSQLQPLSPSQSVLETWHRWGPTPEIWHPWGPTPQTWHPRGPTPAGVSTPQLVIHNQAAAFLHKPSHLSAWLWREGFITSLGAGSPLQIRWFMQTDTSLCRLLISLSWTRSSSLVTAVTSHLNHPTLLSLPALIDAVIFLPSKHPLASCSCAGERGPGPEGL